MLSRVSAVIMVILAAACLVAANEPTLAQHKSTVAGNASDVGIEFSQLFLRTSSSEKNARVYFGRGGSSFSVGANSQGQFSVAVSQPSGNAPDGFAHSDKDLLVVGKDHIAASTIIARSVHAHQLEIDGTPQWQLVRDDSFAPREYRGWANANAVLTCGAINVLTVPEGGKVETSTSYFKLPPHSLVRIVATVHFIDDWQGETAYLKVNGEYVWTDSHELRSGARALNVCGSDKFPETKFTATIDVTLPATAAGVYDVGFGTTTEAGSLARFGVSSFSIYTRNTGV